MSLQIKSTLTQKSIVSSIDISSSVPSFRLSVSLPSSFQCSYPPFFPQRRTGSVCVFVHVFEMARADVFLRACAEMYKIQRVTAKSLKRILVGFMSSSAETLLPAIPVHTYMFMHLDVSIK